MRVLMSFLVAAVALFCGACQSAKVADARVNHEIGTSTVVWVEPFDVSQAAFIGDQGPHTREEVRDNLTGSLIGELVKAGLEARTGGGSDGVVVRGSISLIDAGSGSTRAWVGFGAGQSKLVCTADIYNTAISASTPAVTLQIIGGTHGKAGWQAAGYPCLADAGDAAEQIAKYIKENRR